jgi:DNA-binding beta-propeller fold protein YncE
MTGSFGRTLLKRAVLCTLGVVLIAGCSQNLRQIAIALPSQTGDPAPLDRALFLSTAGASLAGSVTMVDVSGDTNVGVETVGLDPLMIGLTFGGGRAVVPNSASNTASSFQTGVAFGTISTTTLPPGSGASFVGSRQNGKFYVALTALNELGVVDFTLAVIKEVPLTGCSSPVALSQVPGGGNVYVACSGGNVAVVSPNDNVLLTTITDAGSPRWIEASPDGKYMFVANQGTSSVDVICSTTDVTVCAGNTVITSIGVAGAPNFVKYDTHTQHVLVAGAGFVSVLDASGTAPTFADIKDLPGSGQTWVTALPDGSRIYVSDAGAQTVTSYSASNYGLLKTISLVDPLHPISAPASTTPIMIDSDKNSSRVYTANTGSNDFTIINTLTDTEVFPGPIVSGQPTRLTPPAGQIPKWVVVLP